MSGRTRWFPGDIDHLVLAVPDLDEARSVYERMGFAVSPRAEHEALGTANHVFVFPSSYCELLGVVRPDVARTTVGGELAAGSGVSGLALCGSADTAKADYADRGIAAGEAIEFSRDASIGDEVATARFRISRLEDGAAPGFFAFVCEHLTPELVWHEAAMIHANRVTGVAEVVIRADAPGEAAEGFERLGPRSVAGRESASGSGLGPRLCFQDPDALITRYPGLDLPEAPGGTREGRSADLAADVRGVGVVFSTPSLTDTIACLEKGGVEYTSARSDAVFVLPGQACGLLVEFTER